MSKVLYSGVDESNKEVNGYIEADDNKDAIKKLEKSGLENIKLHGDASLYAGRDYLDGLSERELAYLAKNEIEMQKKPLSFFSYMMEKLSSSFIPIAIGGAITYYGYSNNSYILASFGTIVAFALPFFHVWMYSSMISYENLVKAVNFGEWEEALKLANSLKNNNKIIKLDQLEAYVNGVIATKSAKDEDISKALKILENDREFYDKTPGMYHNKIGSIYMSIGDIKNALFHYKQGYIEGKSTVMLSDWALIEAMVGDKDIAKKNLENIDATQLPIYALGYLDLIDGIIAYREKRFKEAIEILSKAHQSFSEYSKNPALWSVIALTSAYLALSYDKMNDKESAYSYLSGSILKILKEHAPKGLMSELREHFPSHFMS